MSAEHLDRLLHGRAPLTTEIAQRLEPVTGMPARPWIRPEADYRRILG
ncbi:MULTISPECIES: hypothetical protein [Nonomuraea]|nr:hypothetical protein [Nonomuraea ceibae]